MIHNIILFGMEVQPTVTMGALLQMGFSAVLLVFGGIGGYFALKYAVQRLVERVGKLEEDTKHIATLVMNNAVNERRFMNIEEQLKDFRNYIIQQRNPNGFYDHGRKQE
jgi:hypothetical protein